MADPMTSWAQPEGGAAAPPSAAPEPAQPTTTFQSAAAPVVAGSTPAAPLATPPAKGTGRVTNMLFGIAVVVAVAGLAFAGGRLSAPAAAGGFQAGRGGLAAGSFDPNQAGALDPNQAGALGQGGPGALGQGGPGGTRAITITGTVKSLDGSTLVLTVADGTEMTIDVSGSTYHAEIAAAASDVTSGTSVSVTVDGLGGLRGPNASADPNGGGGTAPISASDVIITGG